MDEYLEAMSDDMGKAIEALQAGLAKIRTGRASPALVESVLVHVATYGTQMPLNQLATIQAPDARLLVITPWDKTTISDIERGIIAAGLGLNPSSDGQIVRLPVPALTAERRQDLVKQVRRVGEETKVRLRHVRREYNDIFKAAEKDGDISEDDTRRLLAKVQEATDAGVVRVDEEVAKKEAEVQEV
ncbi:MAG: ribosome recycling factor [Deltaproteobacteria bacterium]|nr:MAG: ribosome recycling factor [Deltaproteobacteria bacterium]